MVKSRENGTYFKNELKELFQEHGRVEDVRGVGLMLGIEMDMPCAQLVDAMRHQGVLLTARLKKF